MNLLVIGFDRAVADQESASSRRHVLYFTGWRVRFLEIGPGKSVTASIAPSMEVVCAGGRSDVHAAWRALSALHRLLKQDSRINVVTAQDPYIAGILGWLASVATGARLHIQDHSGAASRPPHGLKERFLRPVVWFVFRRAARIRTVSRRGALGLAAKGIPRAHIDIVPVASDLSRFFQIQRTPETNHVVCVARLSREKGLDVLLRAFAEVRKRLPDAKLTIVGEGPQRADLEKLREELGLNAAIQFVGQADPAPYYAKAALYVQPSYFEGWGIAVTEAAAVGLPIVMTDVGCAGEVIVDGESGWVVPPGEAGKLAEAMHALLADPNRAGRLGRAAHAAVRALPSTEARIQAVRESLEKVVSS